MNGFFFHIIFYLCIVHGDAHNGVDKSSSAEKFKTALYRVRVVGAEAVRGGRTLWKNVAKCVCAVYVNRRARPVRRHCRPAATGGVRVRVRGGVVVGGGGGRCAYR